MCLDRRTEYGMFQAIWADTPVSRKKRHPFDRFYNSFSRSAWTARQLAHHVAVATVVRLNPKGLLYLVVDDTLLHKRGKHVYRLGWFRDAVASTAKRVARARKDFVDSVSATSTIELVWQRLPVRRSDTLATPPRR